MLFSIYQFSIIPHLESFPKYIACYWFMASSTKKQICDFEKLRWVSMKIHETKKVVTDGFLGHDLWERNQKLFCMGFEIL